MNVSMPALRIFTGLILNFLIIAGIFHSVEAQNINPQVLERLQNQAERSQVNRNRPSPVDQSREAAREEGETQFGERRHVEPEGISAIERDYRRRLNAEELSQFGYDIFSQYGSNDAQPLGRIDKDYILGIGDEIVAIFQGSEEDVITTSVDSEGRLILGKLPPIEAAGRTFGDVQGEVEQRTQQTLLGTEVFVSVGAVKAIRVQIVGEIARPGSHRLTSLSDIMDALGKAGGVKKTGSLRKISVLRDDRKITIDLYSILTGEQNLDFKLRDADRIVVPPVGETVAVFGSVLRPGIYELPFEGEASTVSEFIKYAGGTIRPRGNGFVVNRIDEDGYETFKEVDDLTSHIQPGDAVSVFFDADNRRKRVSISGHVFAPGARALDKTPTLDDLFLKSGTVKNRPYLPFAVLQREDKTSQITNYKAVNLLTSEDRRAIQLKNNDHLFVLNRNDVDFLTSSEVRNVVLGQENTLVECKALDHLENLISRVQSNRFAAVTRGVFLTEKEGRASVADVGNVETGSSVSGDIGREVRAETLDDRRVPRTFEATGEDAEPACPVIFEENSDLLPFTLEHLVTISGSVRFPGALPVADVSPVESLIGLAGGFAVDASKSEAEIIQSKHVPGSGDIVTKRIEISVDDESLRRVTVKPGDSIRIQSVADDQEVGAVLLTGEFRRPGSYTIQRGETLSQLIERAGGVTEQAYPYGAVFTRRSVKEAQREGFRRAARELNAALATAALKDNVDAEAVKAAQELSVSLSSTEAPGRVVVEADPRVLALRDDLDVVLQPGDTLFMPKRPGHVLTIGDVLNPSALQFIRGKSVSAYLGEAGGLQVSADDERVFLVYPNGVAEPIRVSAWRKSSIAVPPGSTIVVPKDTDPLAGLDLTREIATIASQFAISAASLAVIFDGR